MSWHWSRHSPAELARFVTKGSARWLGLRESPLDYPESRDGRKALIRSIYDALHRKNIRYDREQYDPAVYSQIVRPPNEILGWPGRGTCLDLVLLFCGLCLDFDLLPALIGFRGHAIAAVSLTHGIRNWDSDDRPGWT
jgi:hypothetical protein